MHGHIFNKVINEVMHGFYAVVSVLDFEHLNF